MPDADCGSGSSLDAPARFGSGASAPRGNGYRELRLPGLAPVTAADLMQPARRARRECGEKGDRLAVLDGWSEFLADKYPPDCDFVTLTFRDRFGPHGNLIVDPATPKGAFQKVHQVFRDLELHSPTFWASEPHKWRETLHLHGLTRRLDPVEHDLLFRVWLHRHGMLKILPANPAAVPYVLKYVFKQESCGRFDWIDLGGLRCDR